MHYDVKNADYSFKKNNPNWNLTLDIRIDVGAGEKVILVCIVIIVLDPN